ncbi:MAG: hypothetical protein R2837_11330 [Aliarcobacter sp.]
MYSASDIYYRILEIGSQYINEGISLGNIKNILKRDNMLKDYKNCEHIEQWIDSIFQHKKIGCRCPTKNTNNCSCKDDDPCDEFDHYNICKRFLTKEALIDFSHLEQLRKNNEKLELYKSQLELQEKQILNARKSSNIAKLLSIIAIIISAGTLLLNSYNTFTQTKISNANRQDIMKIKSIQIDLYNTQQSESSHLNQLDTFLQNQVLRQDKLYDLNLKYLEKISK